MINLWKSWLTLLKRAYDNFLPHGLPVLFAFTYRALVHNILGTKRSGICTIARTPPTIVDIPHLLNMKLFR